jgi:starvation-inducible DNA-binding protein
MSRISNTPSGSIRCKAIELLNRHLLAAVDLRMQVQEAHRNVGSGFIAIHELLDQVAEAVAGYSGTISERSVVLGTLEETSEAAVERSFLARYKLGIADAESQVAAAMAALAAFGQSVRQAIDEAAAFGDTDTSDVFAEVSRGIDYHLWLVESHLSWPMALRRRDGRRLYPASRKFTGYYPASLAAARNGM